MHECFFNANEKHDMTSFSHGGVLTGMN